MAHLLEVESSLKAGARRLARGLPQAGAVGDFPRSRIGRDLRNAARLFSSPASPGMIKVSHGSFDTHANQQGAHQRLLAQLAEALAAFRAAMLSAGQWRDVLVMTYSEFGRRAGENASRGTDHGTAAAHLLLGGRVKGGGSTGDRPIWNTWKRTTWCSPPITGACMRAWLRNGSASQRWTGPSSRWAVLPEECGWGRL